MNFQVGDAVSPSTMVADEASVERGVEGKGSGGGRRVGGGFAGPAGVADDGLHEHVCRVFGVVFEGGVNVGGFVFLGGGAGDFGALAGTGFEAGEFIAFGEGVTETVAEVSAAAVAELEFRVGLDFRP